MIILGMIAGMVTVLIGLWAYRNWRDVSNYEKAVLAHLGSDYTDYYDEYIMYDMYDMGYSAADTAREMIAVQCND